MTDIPGYTKIDLEETAKKLREQPDIDLNTHDLRQEGYRLIDVCHDRTISIPAGKNLTGKKGAYKLEDEPRVSSESIG